MATNKKPAKKTTVQKIKPPSDKLHARQVAATERGRSVSYQRVQGRDTLPETLQSYRLGEAHATQSQRDNQPLICHIATTPENSDLLILPASALARRGIDL